MPLSQNRPVVPPSRTDGMLRDFAQIIQKGLSDLYQAAHYHKIVTAAPNANDGSIGDIYIVNTSTDTYLTIKTSAGWVSQNSAATAAQYFSPTIYVGPSQPKNFSVSVATGGTVTPDTYLYKIYPLDKNQMLGMATAEVQAIVTSGHQTVTMTWEPATGADSYIVTRSSSAMGSGGFDAYFRVAGGNTSSFTDSGQTISGTLQSDFINADHILMASFGGGIVMPSSYGAIHWMNFHDGTLGGYITVTSAAEMEFGTHNGIYPAHYYFDNQTEQQWLTIDCSGLNVSGPQLCFGDGSANREGYINGIKLHFLVNGNEKLLADGTNFTISLIPKFAGTNTTGSKTASLGTNGPMVTTTPYTWVQVVTADGSTGYIPVWK